MSKTNRPRAGAAIAMPCIVFAAAIVCGSLRADEIPNGDAPPATPQPANPTPRAEVDPNTPLRFVFHEAPWPEVLRQFADWTGLTLDLTDTPPGAFSYYDNRRHTVAEAIDILNGYLLPRGYVLLRRDRFLAVLKTDNPVLPNLVPVIKPEELSQRGENELLRVVFPVTEMDAKTAAAEIGKMTGPLGSAAPLESIQSVLVQGFGRTLRDVAAMLDQAVAPITDDRLEFRSFPLKHLPAIEAERQIRQLFGLGSATLNVSGARYDVERSMRYRGGRGRDEDDNDGDRREENTFSATPLLAQAAMNMQVSALSHTNSVLVTATPAGLAIVEKIVTAIDTPVAQEAISLVDDGVRTLRVYTVEEADEQEVAKTLDAVMPGVVVNEDSRGDSIHILATSREHKEVEALIRTLDGAGDGQTIEVIPLTRFDPSAMSTLLSKMFDNEDRDDRPIIQAEPHTRTLIVRGSRGQIEQVRSTLLSYGEKGSPADAAYGSRIRRVIVGAQNAEQVARTAEEILSQDQRFSNPIRVVIPGQTSSEPERPLSDDAEPPKTKVEVDRKSARREPLPLMRVVSLISDEPDNQAEQGEPSAESTGESKARPPRSSSGENRRDARPPRVNIEVRGDQLFLYSADEAALDEVEEMIRALVRQMPDRTSWTVFYLRAAEAASTASLLYQLMPLEGLALPLEPTTSSPSDAVYGLTGPSLRIVPDARTNALFVSGMKEQVDQVESFLELLDTTESPNLLSDRIPRTIPVQYARAADVANALRELYKDFLVDPNARQRDERDRGRDESRDYQRDGERRIPSPSDVRGTSGRPVGIRLTLAVDEQANELIVSCNEPLFRQISALVKERDEAARSSQPTIGFVQLPGAAPPQAAAVLQALQAMSPNVTVTQSPVPITPQAQPQSNSYYRSSRYDYRGERSWSRD
jgi:type II secretory pathway component GspD/PulD (secretin)